MESGNFRPAAFGVQADTGSVTATGKLMLTVLGGIAQFEREIMLEQLERQLEGIAKAKLDGKYKGRKPLSDEKRAQVHMLAKTGAGKECSQHTFFAEMK